MAEMNHRCFAIVKAIMKLQSPGGLNYLLVPNPTDATKWNTIDKPSQWKHNSWNIVRTISNKPTALHSHSTLVQQLQYNSLSPYAEEVLNRTAQWGLGNHLAINAAKRINATAT